MKEFVLDSRLAGDCFLLAESDTSLLLLMDNARVPWFILVPKTEVKELYELEPHVQQKVIDELNALSSFLKKVFQPDKLNVAAIGNIVSQLHIHIVGRSKSDYCWPNVVWGAAGAVAYSETELQELKHKVLNELPEFRVVRTEDCRSPDLGAIGL